MASSRLFLGSRGDVDIIADGDVIIAYDLEVAVDLAFTAKMPSNKETMKSTIAEKKPTFLKIIESAKK